jgi:hypothetical protein
MRSDVERRFNNHLKNILTVQKPGLTDEKKGRLRSALNFLLDHPTKPKVIDNICEQVKLVELSGVTINKDKYTNLIEEVARFWAHTAVTAKEQEILSEAEKNRIRKEAEYLKEAEAEITELETETEKKETEIKVYQTK